MKKKTENIFLLLTFLLALGFRLAFVFRVPFFSSDAAYFNLRHSEHIANHLFPIVYDPLSYGGNVIVHTHLFHYFLGFFDIFLTQSLVYKILPEILASSIVIFVYVIAKYLTKNQYAAFFGALLAAFVPSYISHTINQISSLSVYIPILLLLLSALMAVKKEKNLFLVLSFVLILLDPLNMLMLFTLVIYLTLLISESVPIQREEKEAIGFFILFFVLLNLVLYRGLYFEQGLAAVWQNLPLSVYGELFQDFDLLSTINLVGVVPLVFGIAGFILAKQRDKPMMILKAVLLAAFALLLLKLIPFEQGVLILAVILCITSTITFAKLVEYVRITKVARYGTIMSIFFVFVTVASLVIPSTTLALEVVDSGVSDGEIEALSWIKDRSGPRSVVVGNVNEGNLIIYLANRSNVIDTSFILAEDRVLDIDTIYSTESLVLAQRALDKYDVDYVYFSQQSKERYGVDSIVLEQDPSCYEERFANEQAVVYRVVC